MARHLFLFFIQEETSEDFVLLKEFQYEKYANDLNLLNEVNYGKIIVIALYSDKAYTYDEVVIGDKQQLTSLSNQPYIKASSFDAIIDTF